MKTRQLSYKLRTNQIVLPVKKFVENLYDLPLLPEIGKCYNFRGQKVKCIEDVDKICDYCVLSEQECNGIVKCNKSNRPDKKDIKIVRC